MKVLFVTNMWPDEARPWRGAFVKSQADSLARLGTDLDVMPIRGYAGRAAYLTAAGRLARLNASRSYDVIHAHYGHSGVVARLQMRAPVILSYCGDDLLGTRSDDGSLTPRSRIEAAVFRRLAGVLSATITKSAEMAARLPEAFRRRNHVIPNGVDMERFRPRPRDEARRELGWPEDEAVALFAADPGIATKNHRLAQDVCERAARTLPSLRLRVAAGLTPDTVPTAMSAADALLLTSQSEGSPNVVKEAMAVELPVVATPVGDVPERLDGIPGCFVRNPEVGALAEALLAAVDHGRTPAARQAVSELSLERVATRVADVYEEVLRRRRQG